MSKDGGPAFPDMVRLQLCKQTDLTPEQRETVYHEARGMSLRDYFAIHAPEPTNSDVATQMGYDKGRNPHNDPPPKPPLRSTDEIRAYLRYRYADAMLQQRDK